ncbi:MAG: nitronate monooxygenase, partial [Proteobacteria bacterium]|nr:nitronate monooxygenase [Pseudomonadota bacterium]
EYPIMCGGMFTLAVPKLCAAISEAGALGNLTAATYPTGDDLRAAIRETRKLTKKPFCINVTMLPAMMIGDEHYQNWFNVIADEGVAGVEIGGKPLDRLGNGEHIKILHDAGVKIMHKVGAVKHGKHAQEAGYDAVIAAGVEEGGHPLNENVATMVLSQRMAEELKIPVISTGGCCTGRALAAALCLGAEGIMFASRFICTPECDVHDNVRKELIRRQENETVLYGNAIGLQGRALLNDTLREVLKIEAEPGGTQEEKLMKVLPLIAGTHGPTIWREGNLNVGSINVGQSIGLIHKVMPVKELIQEIVSEAKQQIQKASKAI